jgi:hypothetical protein
MGFIKSFLKPQAAKPAPAAAPKAPAQYPPVPTQLPKITAPTASQIAQSANPSPAAQQILKANPQQTPAQYLAKLQDQHMGDEMVKTMAHGLPDREGVHWAAQSAEKVSDKLPPHEVQGLKAAQAWAKNPTPENQAAARAAAVQGGWRGPGSMAAQGAAWSQPGTPAASGAGAAAPRLTPHAVTGAVLMSAAIKANPAVAVPAMAAPVAKAPALAAPSLQAPKLAAAAPQAPAVVPPAIQAQTFQQQHPFIKMGLDIASGKSPVG